MQVLVRSVVTSIVFSSNLQNIILYIWGRLVSNRFCIDAQSLLWLCQVSQSLTLRERGGAFAVRPRGCAVGRVQLLDAERRRVLPDRIRVCESQIPVDVGTFPTRLERGCRYR